MPWGVLAAASVLLCGSGCTVGVDFEASDTAVAGDTGGDTDETPDGDGDTSADVPGDSDGGDVPGDTGGNDADTSVPDSDTSEPDGGDTTADADMPDPCADVAMPCATASSACSEGTLTICAARAEDGCLEQTVTDCAALDALCAPDGASCVQPTLSTVAPMMFDVMLSPEALAADARGVVGIGRSGGKLVVKEAVYAADTMRQAFVPYGSQYDVDAVRPQLILHPRLVVVPQRSGTLFIDRETHASHTDSNLPALGGTTFAYGGQTYLALLQLLTNEVGLYVARVGDSTAVGQCDGCTVFGDSCLCTVLEAQGALLGASTSGPIPLVVVPDEANPSDPYQLPFVVASSDGTVLVEPATLNIGGAGSTFSPQPLIAGWTTTNGLVVPEWLAVHPDGVLLAGNRESLGEVEVYDLPLKSPSLGVADGALFDTAEASLGTVELLLAVGPAVPGAIGRVEYVGGADVLAVYDLGSQPSEPTPDYSLLASRRIDTDTVELFAVSEPGTTVDRYELSLATVAP